VVADIVIRETRDREDQDCPRLGIAMNKETVLASIRTTLRYSESTGEWARGTDSWVQDESHFLGEFRNRWNQALISEVAPPVTEYFADLGLEDPDVVGVRVAESYPGSWVMEAFLIIQASATATYMLLKGLAEIPRIADGLVELKNRVLRPRVEERLSTDASDALTEAAEQQGLRPPPAKPVEVDFMLDARPLRGLRPGTFQTHRLHLGVALSDDSLSFENIGDEALENLQLGLFVGDEQRHQWALEDAFLASVPSLGARQTLVRSGTDFRDQAGDAPDLESASFVDCWVQDRNGIYLFQFARDDAS
jgi:hypothetical protein